MLVDLRNRNLTGKLASDILDKLGITVNKNAIPDDPQSPLVTSGIRIGSPACTTRGLKEAEFETLAGIIDQALANPKDAALHAQLRRKTMELCDAFPLYGKLMRELYS